MLVLPDQFREDFLCTGSLCKTPRIKFSVFLSEPSLPDPCTGVRIRCADLCEIVRQDLNHFVALPDEQIDDMVKAIVEREASASKAAERKAQKDRAEAWLKVIDKMVTKLDMDNAEVIVEQHIYYT